MKKVILAVVILVIATALIWWYWPQTQNPDLKINASELLETFEQDEAKGNKMYLGKLIQVSGTIAEMEMDQQGRLTLMLREPNAFGGVLVTLEEGHEKIFDVGEKVEIVGECNGFLFDVVLNNGKILSSPNN